MHKEHRYSPLSIYINTIILIGATFSLIHQFRCTMLGITINTLVELLSGIFYVYGYRYARYHNTLSLFQAILYICSGTGIIVYNILYHDITPPLQATKYLILIGGIAFGIGYLMDRTQYLTSETSVRGVQWGTIGNMIYLGYLCIIATTVMYGYYTDDFDWYISNLIGLIMLCQGSHIAWKLYRT